LVEGKMDFLTKLLPRISVIFSHSPIENEFLFWQKFEENNLDEAIKIGERLVHRFPNNDHYRFNLAYTYFCNEDLENAIQRLEDFDLKTRKQDPDTLSLLGYGYLLKSKDKKNSKEWEKAKHYFTLAKSQAEKIGIPSSETSLALDYMDDNSKQLRPTDSQFWLVPITPRREAEFMTSTEQETDYLFHELQKDIKKGDVIFLTSLLEKNLRILAVYKVKQTHIWHPYIKNQGLLELVERLLRPIEIPHIDLRNRTEQKPLTEAQRNICLNQLEEFAPIQQKLKQPLPKHNILKLRRVS